MMITTQILTLRPMPFSQPSRTLLTFRTTALITSCSNNPALHLVGLPLTHVHPIIFSCFHSSQANSHRQTSRIINSRLQVCNSQASASWPPISTKHPCTTTSHNTLSHLSLDRLPHLNPLICTILFPHPSRDQTHQRTVPTITTDPILGIAASPTLHLRHEAV